MAKAHRDGLESHASADQLICAAIAERRLVTFTLDGFRRIAEPHDYGIIDGAPRLFFYQVGGESRSGRPIGWRWGHARSHRAATFTGTR